MCYVSLVGLTLSLLRVRVGAMGVLQQSRRSLSVDKAWTKRGRAICGRGKAISGSGTSI